MAVTACWRLLAFLGYAFVALAVRPVMDEELLPEKDKSKTQDVATSIAKSSAAKVEGQNISNKTPSLLEHRAGGEGIIPVVADEEVPIVQNILRLLNSDPSDFEWKWSPDVKTQIEFPPYEALSYGALTREEAMVNHLLIRHGLAVIYASRSERADQFVGEVGRAARRKAKEEDVLSTYVNILANFCRELKEELEKLSLEALLHLRYTDLLWARNLDDDSEEPEKYSAFQAGESKKAWQLAYTVLGFSWHLIVSTDQLYIKYMREFRKIGRDLRSQSIHEAIFSPYAAGEAVVVRDDSLKLKAGRSMTPGLKNWVITAVISFPHSGYSAQVAVSVTEEEKQQIEGAVSLGGADTEKEILFIRVHNIIGRMVDEHAKFLFKDQQLRDILWAHELGQWVRHHSGFQPHTLTSMVNSRPDRDMDPDIYMDKKYVWQSKNRDFAYPDLIRSMFKEPPKGGGGEYDYESNFEVHLPSDSAASGSSSHPSYDDYDNEDTYYQDAGGEQPPSSQQSKDTDVEEPDLEEDVDDESLLMPLSMQNIFAELNSDASDMQWEWTPVHDKDLEDENFVALELLHGLPGYMLPEEIMARHLLFRHGFALIYVTRLHNYDSFISYIASELQEAGETQMQFYVRVLLAFCADFLGELVSLGWDGLQRLHVSDSKWGIQNQHKKSRWYTNADEICGLFQAAKSKRVWNLFTGILQLDQIGIGEIDTKHERYLFYYGRVSEEAQSYSLMRALSHYKAMGPRRIGHDSLEAQDSKISSYTSRRELMLLGQIEFWDTGFKANFDTIITREQFDHFNSIKEPVPRKAAMAAHVQEVIERVDSKHDELLQQYPNIVQAYELFVSLRRDPRWKGYVKSSA
mmetsp:Transcript_38193/g.89618  ORF Transcript_38193/g.89618 Transcript_38193/m.89618 type:complete len:858 (-) Transcript_38193:55-2628(-)